MRCPGVFHGGPPKIGYHEFRCANILLNFYSFSLFFNILFFSISCYSTEGHTSLHIWSPTDVKTEPRSFEMSSRSRKRLTPQCTTWETNIPPGRGTHGAMTLSSTPDPSTCTPSAPATTRRSGSPVGARNPSVVCTEQLIDFSSILVSCFLILAFC